MSKLNISVNVNTYSDKRSSNAPSLSNFKWNRVINGIDAENAQSQNFTIPANTTVVILNSTTAKKFTYLETSADVTMAINNAAAIPLKAVVINNSTFPGVFMRTSDINKIEITNGGTEEVSIFLATVE